MAVPRKRSRAKAAYQTNGSNIATVPHPIVCAKQELRGLPSMRGFPMQLHCRLSCARGEKSHLACHSTWRELGTEKWVQEERETLPLPALRECSVQRREAMPHMQRAGGPGLKIGPGYSCIRKRVNCLGCFLWRDHQHPRFLRKTPISEEETKSDFNPHFPGPSLRRISVPFQDRRPFLKSRE